MAYLPISSNGTKTEAAQSDRPANRLVVSSSASSRKVGDCVEWGPDILVTLEDGHFMNYRPSLSPTVIKAKSLDDDSIVDIIAIDWDDWPCFKEIENEDY